MAGLAFDPSAFYNQQYVDNLETQSIGGGKYAKNILLYDANGNPLLLGAATTANLSTVAGSNATGVLFAANTNRKGIVIHNDSSAILYVAFAATASSTAFTYRLNPYDTVEPKINYNGVISGIWASSAGNARLTELT